MAGKMELGDSSVCKPPQHPAQNQVLFSVSQVLFSLQQAVQKHQRAAAELAQLIGCMQHRRLRAELPGSSLADKPYAVELLDLSIK